MGFRNGLVLVLGGPPWRGRPGSNYGVTSSDRRPVDTPSRLPAHLRLAAELYAEDRVIVQYEADRWVLQRVSHRKLGWDLTATRGAEHGTSRSRAALVSRQRSS
jgi:hypothetical protein